MIERESVFGVKVGSKWVRSTRKDGTPVFGRSPFKFHDAKIVRDAVTEWADHFIGHGKYELVEVCL